MDEREALLVVALADGIGSAGAERLRRRFGSYAAAVEAAGRGASAEDERTRRHLRSVAAVLRRGDAARQRESADRGGARVIVLGDPEYPGCLAEIARPPLALFVRGCGLGGALPAVAVVGTRRATPEGRETARYLAADLAEAGVAVVSGLARGIDTAAHRGALEVGGSTVAVLGSGLDAVYPPENRGLAESIAAAGSVVSEFPMDREARPGHFPSRNRIIAGLSAGVVVVEAGAKSGALITAARAVESGREVFAVPGPIARPGSRGPNGLIKEGAKLVESVADILDELRPAWGPFRARAKVGPRGPEAGTAASAGGGGETEGRVESVGGGIASRVRSVLSAAPLSADAIAERLRISVSSVLVALTELELSGDARSWPGGRYTSGDRRLREERGEA